MLRSQSIGAKVKIIFPIASPPRSRRPEVISRPPTRREDIRVLCPSHQIRRGKGVKVSLVFKGNGRRRKYPKSMVIDSNLWICIETWEERVVNSLQVFRGHPRLEREEGACSEVDETNAQNQYTRSHCTHLVYGDVR